MIYKPLIVKIRRIAGIEESLEDMRLPHNPYHEGHGKVNPQDLILASKLILAGNDHAKAMRGIVVWFRLRMQIGFMIEFETYRHGIECLSTSSTMHTELKHLKGYELAEEKQRGLSDKVYVRGLTASYQALRHIYRARRKHRHPDWKIFCDSIETLPYFKNLIYPEVMK